MRSNICDDVLEFIVCGFMKNANIVFPLIEYNLSAFYVNYWYHTYTFIIKQRSFSEFPTFSPKKSINILTY